MEREDTVERTVIDLGAVSTETKGLQIGSGDVGQGRNPTGLTDD